MDYEIWKFEQGLSDGKLRVDPILNRYIVHLWELGGRTQSFRSKAKQTHAAVVQGRPELSGALPLCLASLRAWKKSSPSLSYPPIPREVMLHVVNLLYAQDDPEYALGIWMLFDGLGRASEILKVPLSQVYLPKRDPLSPQSSSISLTLSNSKTGVKSLCVSDPHLVEALSKRIRSRREEKHVLLFDFSYAQLKKRFSDACAVLGLARCGFVLHSLRHGGATFFYHVKKLAIEDIAVRGHWRSLEALRTYLQSARLLTLRSEISPSLLDADKLPDQSLFVTLTQ